MEDRAFFTEAESATGDAQAEELQGDGWNRRSADVTQVPIPQFPRPGQTSSGGGTDSAAATMVVACLPDSSGVVGDIAAEA